MRILMLGDIMGRPGRDAVARELPALRAAHAPQLVVANGENASGGVGLTPNEADELLALGIDVLTGGNHTFKFKELYAYMDAEPRVIRPANLPAGTPGRGMTVVTLPSGTKAAVGNLLGRIFMDPADCPFATADAMLEFLAPEVRIVIMDMHAEATSEKQAIAWHLDGRATLVAGTHTHVQTSDARLLPKGTAAITDLGMCGVEDSILGMDPGKMVQKFRTSLPARSGLAKGEARVHGVVVDADETTGRATAIALV